MKRIILAGFLFITFVFFYVFEEPSRLSFGAQQENIFSQNKYNSTRTTSSSEVTQWAKTYGGVGADLGGWIIEKTDGSGYIVGQFTCTFDAGGTEHGDIWILDLSPSGDINWQRTYGGVEPEKLYGGIQETSDGGYIVAGYAMASVYGTHIFWILKLTSSGDIEWQRTYGGESDMDFPYSIQVTIDGGYIVAGATYSFGAGESDYWILKLTSFGDIEWQKTYGGSSDDRAHSIRLTEDGGYIVIGRTESYGAGEGDFWILKLSLSGDIEWQRTYGGSGYDWPVQHFQQTSDGGYIVSGTTESFGAGEGDLWILKFTSNWDIEWQRTYGGSRYEEAASVKETIDGGYIVRGNTESFGAGEEDGWLLKLTSSGDIEWQRTYGGSKGDGIWGIQVTSEGGYIVTGSTDSFGAGDEDLWVLKLSPNGDIPSCGIMGISDASVSDTSVSPSDTNVIPMDTNVIPQNIDISPRESGAVVHNLCPGPYTLTLSANAGGTTNPVPGTYTYDDGGTEVTIEAIPDSGYTFSGWSGDASGTNSSITIAMDSDKSITASFAKEEEEKKGRCFIATAAYGSPLHPYVKIFRDFRDRYLRSSKLGCKLVDLYYKYSPFAAELITKHKVLKVAFRINILPLVAFSYAMLHFGPAITAVMLVFIFMLPIFLISFFRRKLRRIMSTN